MKQKPNMTVKVKTINVKSKAGVIALAKALARQMAEQDYKKDKAA